MSKYFGDSSYFSQAQEHFKKMAAEIDLPIGNLDIIANSRIALMLGEYVKEYGKYEAYHKAVFHAYWAEGKNIGDLDILQKIMNAVGLKFSATSMPMYYQELVHKLDDNLNDARKLGINAIPAFIIGEEKVIGAQPYHVIKQIVERIITQNQ